MVIIRTTFGPITLQLDADKAPQTVANFLEYAKARRDDHHARVRPERRKSETRL